jgi:hypothetical protein
MLKRLLAFSCFALYISFSGLSQEMGKSANGVLDLREWDFNTAPEVLLDGEWKFYWNELLTYPEAQSKESTAIVFTVPWSEQQGKKFPAIGYATYTLQVFLPTAVPNLVLEVPAFYNSYELIVNNKVVSQNGKVGIDKNSSVPEWRFVLTEVSPADTLNMVLHISNFDHSRGGANVPIRLGIATSLKSSVQLSNLVTKILVGILLGLALFFFFYLKNRKIGIYYSLFCLSWLVRLLFSNHYLYHEFFEMSSWALAVRIEYLSLFTTVIFGVLYIGGLYRQDSYPVMKYFLVTLNVVFIFLILVLTPATFSAYVWLYLAVAMLMVMFAFFIVLRALVYDRAGVWFSVASFILMALLFGYNIVAYLENFDVNSIVFYSGFMVAFILNGYALHYRSTHTDKSDMLTMEELYAKK